MKKNNFRLVKAFTLVELLVVISIIGILAALATVSFSSTQKQARDTQRKSDLKQYQTSLESYANRNSGLFPAWASSSPPSMDNFCSWLGITGTCPNDPKYISDPDDFLPYAYQSDGVANSGSPGATQYVVWAQLENSADYWVVCSSGTVFSSTTRPSISSCQ